jgi:hypothetical protein
VVSVDPDLAMRQAAITRALELKERYDDLVPRAAILEVFEFRGQRISFGSLQRGIHRPRQMRGSGALSIMTAPPVPGKERGPMLRERLQGFHGAVILKPMRAVDHPDPKRLGLRFAAFEQAA